MTSQLRAPVAPGRAVGILGGGQLARMLTLAAARLGLRTVILAPEGDAPASDVAWRHLKAPYTDEAALRELAAISSVVTQEWENVPASAALILAQHVPVLPRPAASAVKEDRLAEKQFLAKLGVEVARFHDLSSAGQLEAAGNATGFPAVLKTRRMGYDGKGQVKAGSRAQLAAAWESLDYAPAILEAFVAFDGEASIIAARGADASFAAYDLIENTHTEDHILRTSRVPARWSSKISERALELGRKIADALDYVGVLGVEFFVVGDRLTVNEIAPRVHNSGHWTLDAAATSQFEQHIRAICGWPLASTERHSDAVMTNLIGKEVEEWRSLSREPSAHLHLYGKREVRPGRKMGHVTRTTSLTRPS